MHTASHDLATAGVGSSSLYIGFKLLLPDAVNMGFIGSTCTALPWLKAMTTQHSWPVQPGGGDQPTGPRKRTPRTTKTTSTRRRTRQGGSISVAPMTSAVRLSVFTLLDGAT